jgi:DNA-binding response OmpR family regulator
MARLLIVEDEEAAAEALAALLELDGFDVNFRDQGAGCINHAQLALLANGAV